MPVPIFTIASSAPLPPRFVMKQRGLISRPLDRVPRIARHRDLWAKSLVTAGLTSSWGTKSIRTQTWQNVDRRCAPALYLAHTRYRTHPHPKGIWGYSRGLKGLHTKPTLPGKIRPTPPGRTSMKAGMCGSPGLWWMALDLDVAVSDGRSCEHRHDQGPRSSPGLQAHPGGLVGFGLSSCYVSPRLLDATSAPHRHLGRIRWVASPRRGGRRERGAVRTHCGRHGVERLFLPAVSPPNRL